MGSFNIQCGASRQVISTDDRCRVMAIQMGHSFGAFQVETPRGVEKIVGFFNNRCSVDSFWEPVTSFLPAVYDDYGRVNLVLDTNTRIQLLTLFKDGLENFGVSKPLEEISLTPGFNFPVFMAQSAPKLHQAFGTRASIHTMSSTEQYDEELKSCFQHLWSGTQEGSVFINHYTGARPVSFAVLHEDAYQALVDKVQSYSGHAFEQVLPQLLTECRKDAKEFLEAGQDEGMTEFYVTDRMKSLLARLGGSDGLPNTPEQRRVRQLVRDHKFSVEPSDTDAAFIEDLKPLAADRYAYRGMRYLGLTLSPAFSGGQNGYNETGQDYAKFVQSVSAKVTRGRLEHMYGEFREYTANAPLSTDFKALSKLAREWDAAIDDVRTQLDVDDTLSVRFSCTMKKKDLIEFLKENEPRGLMYRTLSQCTD